MSRTFHKERETHYRRSRAFDPSCRSHGGCPWCQGNRQHQWRKYPTLQEELRMAEEDILAVEFTHIWNGARHVVEKTARERLTVLIEATGILLQLNEGRCPFCDVKIVALRDGEKIADHAETCRLDLVLKGQPLG
jgi:hypothetical protein